MVKSAVLTAAGDVVIRERLLDEEERIVDSGYASTAAYLRDSDASFGSCEVQFSARGYRTDAPIAYRVPPVVADDLARAAFDIMTVATNHTCDFGEEAFVDTLDALSSAGVDVVGGGLTFREAIAPVIRTVGGLEVATLAVSCLLPPDYSATETRPGIAPLRVDQSVDLHPLMMLIEPGAPLKVRSAVRGEDLARLTAQIGELRDKVDLVVVSVHWGYGRGAVLAEYQRPLAHALVDAGADLLLGNHTHSPGPIEVYKGVPIVYSLGNHIAQQDWAGASPAQAAIFADIDEWSTVARFVLEPHAVREIELRATFCPRSVGLPALLTDDSAIPVFDRIQRLSAPFGTKILIDGDRATIRTEG
ncbi:CapA family protein [Rhodococcus sp. ACT016]|uniref:CapA family protein n=1 Tax=Rhodococcus sp. ACT016 TaxID=3134808 RepID=UPI003D2763FC